MAGYEVVLPRGSVIKALAGFKDFVGFVNCIDVLGISFDNSQRLRAVRIKY